MKIDRIVGNLIIAGVALLIFTGAVIDMGFIPALIITGAAVGGTAIIYVGVSLSVGDMKLPRLGKKVEEGAE